MVTGSDLLPRLYVGIGIQNYDYWPELPRAIADVDDVARSLERFDFTTRVLPDLGYAGLRDLRNEHLKVGLVQNGALVVLWSGHATLHHQGLQLALQDSPRVAAADFTSSMLAEYAAYTGAGQILILLDTCFSGAAALTLVEVIDQIRTALPPASKRLWLGVVASAQAFERAKDGVFVRKLLQVLAEGPKNPDLKLRWSAQSRGIWGEDLIAAILEDWDDPAQEPKKVSTGRDWVLFPNPLHNPNAPERVVEHLLLAARGADPDDSASYFTGRTALVDTIVNWMREGKPGLMVVTGPAGAGKSAIVGRIVSLSNPEERSQLLERTGKPEHADPGERSVHAHVHARKLTLERVAVSLDEQLSRAGVIDRQATARNYGDLLGALIRAKETAERELPVIVIDGLDEAEGEAWKVVDQLVRPLAPYARVLLSTRELPARSDTEKSLLGSLPPGVVLDIGEAEAQAEAREAVRGYVLKRLAKATLPVADAGPVAGVSAEKMDAEAVAEAVVNIVPDEDEGLFLLARVITQQLRAEPIDTTVPGWEGQLSRSIEQAFDKDLAQLPAWKRGDRALPQAHIELLTALAWSYGAGLPDDIWPLVATAISPTNTTYNREDVYQLLGEAGRYIVEGGDGGRAVYRLSHQRLVEYLRARHNGSSGEDEEAVAWPLRLAQALVRHYLSLLEGGRSPDDHTYLWLFCWRHCTDAGLAGIDELRRLVEVERSAFLPDLAMALSNLGNRYSKAGQRLEAVTPAEEIVELYRELTAASPDFLPNLAVALNNLGTFYSEAGRRAEAVAPTEEAVALYRELARTNAAFLPDLASALNNLGIHYSAVGRRLEAVAPTEEGVVLYRNLATANPAFLPDLANILSNLGVHYGQAGRRLEAIAPTEEAVDQYRAQVTTNTVFLPDLAGTLNNLGIRYSEAGRWSEAVAPTAEAVDLYRDLATANPAYVPDLAMTLNNLGNRFGEAGRWLGAVAPTLEAVDLFRVQAAINPAFLPSLAGALNNLGVSYSEAGLRLEAVAPAEEAVRLRRTQAATNPAFLPNLASALNNLGVRYSEAGRRLEAVAPTEEAVVLLRDLAAANPAHLPDLGSVLNNLSNRYSEAGRRLEAVGPIEEAVELYRGQAATNPAFLPNLAMALTNLGVQSSEAGRRTEAVTHTEEAIPIIRKLAAANPAFLPDLAGALNNLSVRFSEAGLWLEAVAPAEEAVRLLRTQAATNLAFLPDLANALSNLGVHYNRVGRRLEALALTEEAVALLRNLAAANYAYLPDLANALNNLGVRYHASGRRLEAVTAFQEVVGLYGELVKTNPALLPNLATALTNLGNHYNDAGRTDAIGPVWQSVLDALVDPADRAYLLLRRAQSSPASMAGRIAVLLDAATLIPDGRRDLLAEVHETARLLRQQNPSDFDARWREQAGTELPEWAQLDPELLDLVGQWLNAVPLSAEKQMLVDHADELLSPMADVALDEIALLQPEEDALDTFRLLLARAREVGIEEAYRPRLAAELLMTWIRADLAGKRQLFAERRDEMLDPLMDDILQEWAEEDPDDQDTVLAQLLLEAIRQGQEEQAFAALTDPGTFPAMLDNLIRGGNLDAHLALVNLGLSTEVPESVEPSIYLHTGLAHAIAGDQNSATRAVMEARKLAPDQTSAWLVLLVELAARHPEVVPLAAALTTPLPSTEPPASAPSP